MPVTVSWIVALMRASRTRVVRKASRTFKRNTKAAPASTGTTAKVTSASRASSQNSTSAQPVGHQQHEPGREHLGHVLDVAGAARDEPPDRVAVEEPLMQLLDVVEDGLPQVAHGGLAGGRDEQTLRVLEAGAQPPRDQGEGRQPDPGRDPRRRREPAAERAARNLCTPDAIEPGLEDPGGRELEQEERPDQQQRRRDLPAVGIHVLPETQEQRAVEGLAERLFFEDLREPAARPGRPR